MSTNTTLIEALEDHFGNYLLSEADGVERFPIIDLLPEGTQSLDEWQDYQAVLAMEMFDLRVDVTTWTTFAGSLEEPPEYASGGDWAVLDGPVVLASGKVLDEGEWEGDPFSFLRG